MRLYHASLYQESLQDRKSDVIDTVLCASGEKGKLIATNHSVKHPHYATILYPCHV